MIVDGQCYIVIVPGMELPEGPIDGLQRWVEASYPDRSRWCDVETIVECYTYRYPVTEAEYKAHHWCIAHATKILEGFEVIGFGIHAKEQGAFLMATNGNAMECGRSLGVEAPILRKKACEHENTGKFFEPGGFYIECADCGMIRKLGDWETAE